MEYLHSPSAINSSDVNEEVVHENNGLSVTSVNNEDTKISSKSQSDNNIPKQLSSSVTDMTQDHNALMPTTVTMKNDGRISPMNLNTRHENQQISDRASPINGPGLAKLISVTPGNSSGTKRIDAALEKNLETISTQMRRTATKPSQLTQNDLQLFDSTSSGSAKIGQMSREMTPDSINTDSANEESIQNGHHYHRPMMPPSAFDPYGQPLWPPAVYPFPHQHPGLYLPFPPPTNGLPPFYPSYDPLLFEQHYGPQGLSAYYTQQQQTIAARLLQEHPSLSDNFPSILTTPTREHTETLPTIIVDPIRSSDSITNTSQKKNILLNKLSSSFHQNLQTIDGSLSRLSPDLLSDGDGGGTNDADSIISIDSIKSTSAVSMPVLEDGLSDSEQISGDERSPPITMKSTNRHQSTQSDFLFHSSPSSLMPSHKHQFAKSVNNEPEPQTKTSSNRPQLSSSTARTDHQQKISSEESSAIPTDYDTDEETDKLLSHEHRINVKNQDIREAAMSKPSRPREVIKRIIPDPENSSVLIEGVLFRCRYLGSTQLPIEGNPTKTSRMMQAQEAVERIKAPYGESQPSVEVDLFISTEKIMVLNTDLEDILMDHSLRSISYIADIGDLVVLMAKRRYIQNDNSGDGNDDTNGTATRRVVSINQKMICHIFESDEAQSIAHSIGQAFQVAYVEFLKANGIDDPSFTRDIDYQEVLDQQEIAVEELDRFAKKECQKEAIVTKGKNEPLGIVIVESGWGSMLPTVVIANLMPGGPAARGGQLNIGDQVISVNGISMVGLPLSTCQTQIKNMKHLTTVRFVVVPCPPVVEVLIRRPDTKYQLGFSVQNGIICSLLRGGIAERGGVRVGHRIIEINGNSVVVTPHERIVSMLSNSIGELRMKTMPTQMYRLLTGQETPIYI
ncbi:unnamed protein product [Adineta steineri]|uniref:Uncharacterized protein n=2 Tax=Adineta steineri TaxID=433720 RepID=A0A814RPM3_9BILA|nr:unnamed protein product [Adineta steineri]CAF3713927.1 unnamed protein product [Adineta steineri]CAF3883753.1 unnamed protein product [Adineta steineri]